MKKSKVAECPSLSIEDCPKLKMLLPSQMDYHICSYEENSSGFCSCIRLPLHTKEEVTEWKDNFQESSLTTWRVARTHPNERKSILYRVDYRCQHKTRHVDDKYISKNTNCDASMTIKIYKNQMLQNQRKNFRCKLYATTIMLNFIHNHNISTSSALRFRDVPKELEEKFINYFMKGLSVSAAMSHHIADVKCSLPAADWKYALIDRSKVPDKSWCYKVFTKVRKDHPEVKEAHDFFKSQECKVSRREFFESIQAKAIEDNQENLVVNSYSDLQRKLLDFHAIEPEEHVKDELYKTLTKTKTYRVVKKFNTSFSFDRLLKSASNQKINVEILFEDDELNDECLETTQVTVNIDIDQLEVYEIFFDEDD